MAVCWGERFCSRQVNRVIVVYKNDADLVVEALRYELSKNNLPLFISGL